MTAQLMPDFVDDLELRVREAAAPEPELSATARRRSKGWLAAPVLAAAAVAVLLIGLAGTDGRGPTLAYGEPPILQTPPVPAKQIVKELQDGLMARLVLGSGQHLTEARPIPAFGGTAYVVTGDRGWCLTAPDPAVGDPATADPAREGAVTCSPTERVYKYGIALGVGNNAVAALPKNAKDPTVTSPDGTQRDLSPDDQGVVVAAGLPHRTVLTLYGSDGTQLKLQLP